MSLSHQRSAFGCCPPGRSVALPLAASALVLFGLLACRGAEKVMVPPTVELRSITVDTGGRILERGARDTLTATAQDRAGKTVAVPVVWRSSKEKIAIFERGGVLVALDTGTTLVTATSLGVTSTPVPVVVTWLGAAKIAASPWTQPTAVNPGAALADSIRVVVTNIRGLPVANAKVAFNVTSGGGSVSPGVATTGPNGVASGQWTLGQSLGTNTVTASVVLEDGTLNPLVADNAVTFTTRSYVALTIEGGDDQTGQILSALPTPPSVKLVDSLGSPRPGVPVVFTAFENGLVTTAVVSTEVNGVASPGKWTLGDLPGPQALEARVADARVTFRATGTGTPIRYTPASVVAGGASTCALEADGTVKCWGASPQNGTGVAGNISTPTAVKGSLVATSLAGSSTHFCSLTSTGAAWCWGVNALVDTTGQNANPNEPTALQSNISWAQVGPGTSHNCATTTNQVAYCWGANASGQLGDLTQTSRFAPGAVAGGFKFSQISGGFDHSCGLALDGTAFCWGGNQFGQVGDGTTTIRTSPTSVSGGQTFQAIGAGEVFSCGLNTLGRAYCWGGLASAAQPTPITYPTAPTFTALTVGSGHACALTADGTAYCWGTNTWGQLGDSTTVTRAAPTKVAGGIRFAQISAGFQHTCGRSTEGAVACWGRNAAGELGENTSSSRSTPRYIVLGVNP